MTLLGSVMSQIDDSRSRSLVTSTGSSGPNAHCVQRKKARETPTNTRVIIKVSHITLQRVKPRILERAEWFANCSQTVRKPNARMCGWDCEIALRRPQTVCILFTTNQNLSVFCSNTKRTGCASMHWVSFIRLRFAKN